MYLKQNPSFVANSSGPLSLFHAFWFPQILLTDPIISAKLKKTLLDFEHTNNFPPNFAGFFFFYFRRQSSSHRTSSHVPSQYLLSIILILPSSSQRSTMALNTGDKNAKITVLLVTKSNDMIVDRLELQLKDGFLPVRELKKKWNTSVRPLLSPHFFLFSLFKILTLFYPSLNTYRESLPSISKKRFKRTKMDTLPSLLPSLTS